VKLTHPPGRSTPSITSALRLLAPARAGMIPFTGRRLREQLQARRGRREGRFSGRCALGQGCVARARSPRAGPRRSLWRQGLKFVLAGNGLPAGVDRGRQPIGWLSYSRAKTVAPGAQRQISSPPGHRRDLRADANRRAEGCIPVTGHAGGRSDQSARLPAGFVPCPLVPSGVPPELGPGAGPSVAHAAGQLRSL